MSSKNHYVPQYINKNNWLWWEKEELKYVFLPFLVFALFFNYFMLGMLLSLLASYITIRLRRGKPEGYLVHLQYATIAKDPYKTGVWALIFKEKSFPDSSQRHIVG
jgi:hypothetical protein